MMHEDDGQSSEVLGRNRQDVANQERREFIEAAAVTHNHEAEGDGRGREDADDGISRGRALVLDVRDKQRKRHGENDERQQR